MKILRYLFLVAVVVLASQASSLQLTHEGSCYMLVDHKAQEIKFHLYPWKMHRCEKHEPYRYPDID